MRVKLFLIVGLVAILLGPAPGLTQFPGGGEGRGGRPKGGDAKGPRGERGSMRGEKASFRPEMDPRRQGAFDRIAEQAGGRNGPIPPDQFGAFLQQRGGGDRSGFSSPNLPGSLDSRGGRGGMNPDAMMDGMFRRLDQNGDGLLNYDEMPEALRAEREKWDTNGDGFIDLTEFKAYFQARMQQSMLDRRGGPDGLGGTGAWDDPNELPGTTALETERRPVVYHAGKLPKELPSWFAQLDRDRDAQVALYEWKDSGRPLEEFQRYDRNQDGLLTVEEVLRYMAQNKDRPGQPSDSLVMVGEPGGSRGFQGMPFRGPGGRGGDGGGPGARGPRGPGGDTGGPSREPGGGGPGGRPSGGRGPRGGPGR